MLSRLSSHVRHNVVGYLALFFALTGVAYAAGPLKSGDPATGDLTGTYPGPSIAPNAVDTGKLANGSVTTAKFASGAKAPDANTLDSFDSADFGAVMSGRINGLTTSTAATEYGAVSGISTASLNEGDVSTLSPNRDLVARDLSVQLTHAPGPNGERIFDIYVNGGSAGFFCDILDTGTRCNDAGPVSVPAHSTLSIVEFTILPPAAADARFGFRLSP